MKFNKAAMFGLDARIALAIFGALSVILGAALYSAIQQSKVTASIVEMQEIHKAIEQYYLDTGEYIGPQNATLTHDYHRVLRIDKLVSDTATGWNGPYINYPVSSYYLIPENFGQIHAFRLDTASGWQNWSSGLCNNGENCAIWIRTRNYQSIEIPKAIDNMIDGGDGAAAGKVRYGIVSGSEYAVYLQGMTVVNPY